MLDTGSFPLQVYCLLISRICENDMEMSFLPVLTGHPDGAASSTVLLKKGPELLHQFGLISQARQRLDHSTSLNKMRHFTNLTCFHVVSFFITYRGIKLFKTTLSTPDAGE